MKTRFRYWVLIALTIALVVVIFFYYRGRDNLTNILTTKMEQVLPQLLEEYQVPGAALALVRDGEVAWSRGYGLADKEQNVPVTDDTVFQAASISKALTSWGVMRLVENGQLELDAPIEQYLTRWHLPPSSYDASGVTIRRLLSHSAGLSVESYYGLSPELALPSLEESLSGIGGSPKVEIVMEPGTQYGYSNGGYVLLQLIVEEVTGETFSAFMQREVLDPLGMVHSSFEWRADLRPATALGYSQSGSPFPNFLFTEQAASGLYSTAADLARFVAAEMPGPDGEPAGRGVLAPETLALMFKLAITNGIMAGEGLGQTVATLPDGSKVIEHGGDLRGWKARITANPQWGVGIVILTNSDNGMSLVMDMVNMLLTQLIIGSVLRILIFILSVVILVDALFIARKWIKARNSV
jgi:CubicO group peptidase (beta-lactamase class C family)